MTSNSPEQFLTKTKQSLFSILLVLKNFYIDFKGKIYYETPHVFISTNCHFKNKLSKATKCIAQACQKHIALKSEETFHIASSKQFTSILFDYEISCGNSKPTQL